MSAISPSGFSYLAQVSSYAGSLRSNVDTDAARTTASQRAVEADHRAFATTELHEPSEADRPSDRDADGFYAFDGAKEGPAQEQLVGTTAEGESSGTDRRSRRLRGYDDHRGHLIDVQI